jgi:hypothetical protein
MVLDDLITKLTEVRDTVGGTTPIHGFDNKKLLLIDENDDGLKQSERCGNCGKWLEFVDEEKYQRIIDIRKDNECNCGVYAYYSDGTIKQYEQADSNAIGVAVITKEHSFVIDKFDVSFKDKNVFSFGFCNKCAPTCGITLTSDKEKAVKDYCGEGNTTVLLDAGLEKNEVPTDVAAFYCHFCFNSKGYLPALGELKLAQKYKENINRMLIKIGGKEMRGLYWSSTLYDMSTDSWLLDWSYGGVTNDGRDNYYYVRAFAAL